MFRFKWYRMRRSTFVFLWLCALDVAIRGWINLIKWMIQ